MKIGKRLLASAGSASSGVVSSLPRPLSAGGVGIQRHHRELKQKMGSSVSSGVSSGFVGIMPTGDPSPSPASVTEVTSLTLTVADPRQPTAALTVTLPPWVRMQAAVDVAVVKG